MHAAEMHYGSMYCMGRAIIPSQRRITASSQSADMYPLSEEASLLPARATLDRTGGML